MSKEYFLTVGLEVHAELNTKTKMFCGCKNDPNETKPNTNVCPICMAHPGALPVANFEAVKSVYKMGLAINANVADFSEFDRKNYFYPDIPKGYQISQYKYPIVSGGKLHGVDITRVHLEEDTANSKHDRGDFSLVDFNRAGVPLMELVTEPVIHSAKEASDFAKELQLLLTYLGIAEANMEKGEMRVEANISVSEIPHSSASSPCGSASLGTKVEVKNLNSFKSVEKAIEFEQNRMIELLEAGRGNEIVQETRGWDEQKQSTFSQRKKEGLADYRYFPDPDLPKMKLSEVFDKEKIKGELPELPWERRARLRAFGIKDEDTEMYVSNFVLGKFFEDVIADFNEDKTLVNLSSNYITSDLAGILKNNSELTLPDHKSFAKIIEMVNKGELTSRGAKDLLLIITKEGGDPETIAKEKGMLALNDEGAIKEIALKVISENPEVIEQIKSGKDTAIMSLVGKVMKASGGSANPALVQKILKENI